MTGRSDLCIAGVFGAGKTRSLAVLLIALSCELNEFVAIIYTKENVAAKALADQLSDLAPPTLKNFGRLIGRMEESKGEAYASKIDVRCSDRNRIISHKHVLIATGGSATAEMAMRYSTFGHWISRTWLAFMDESQQYGNYHEIAALAAIQQPALTVFIGDHRQTPGGRPADFCPAQLIVNTYMVTLLMVTDLPSGFVQPTMGPQHSFIDTGVARSSFMWVYRIDNSWSSQVSIILMPIGCNRSSWPH